MTTRFVQRWVGSLIESHFQLHPRASVALSGDFAEGAVRNQGDGGNKNAYLADERPQVQNGGADGIRTHDLLDAIEARSQLRHGPTDWLPPL
jgi:hypothetical protein